MAVPDLSQTLVESGAVSASDMDSAVQRQVLQGGSLDTNLLDAGVLGEERMLEELSRCYGLPAVTRKEIDKIGAHIPRLFPLLFAETYHLVPYRLVDETLHVLTNGAADANLMESIFKRLHLKVEAHITTEARLHYAMHRLYASELLPRYQELLGRLDGEPQAAPQSTAPAVKGQDHVLTWGVSSARVEPARAKAGKAPGQDVRSQVARLSAAPDRDTIVDILLSFSLAIFEFAGLFLLHGEQERDKKIFGWRGPNAEVTQRIAQIALPLTVPSVFQTLYATGSHYLGPLMQNTSNMQLLDAFGRAPPRAAFLAPIKVGGKIAAILYADNGDRTVSPNKVAALLVLVSRAGIGLENLIHTRKRAAAAITEVSLADPAPAAANAPPVAESRAPVTAPAKSFAAADDDFGSIMDDAPAAAVAKEDAIGEAAPKSAVKPLKPKPDGFAGLDIDIDFDDEMGNPTEAQPAPAPAPAPVQQPPAPEQLVAFAEVTDSPRESLDDWEDVLVDTVSEANRADEEAMKAAKPAASSVTWQDVVAEAQRAATLQPTISPKVEVLGTVVDSQEILFDGLDADDPEARRSAVTQLLKRGGSIDAALSQRFPGRVLFDPFTQQARPPAFERCSGVTELLAARGPSAANAVMPHLDSDQALARYYATYFFLTMNCPDACEALARRLYDPEPRVRHLAVEALRRYAREAAYERAVDSLREQLKIASPATQIAAVQILGQLREPSAVLVLIPLVTNATIEVARAAASSLAVVCAQAFGNDIKRWQAWWQANSTKPRTTWLIEGLSHTNPTIRRVAHGELQNLTGQSFAFNPEAAESERAAAVQTWQRRLQTVLASNP